MGTGHSYACWLQASLEDTLGLDQREQPQQYLEPLTSGKVHRDGQEQGQGTGGASDLGGMFMEM